VIVGDQNTQVSSLLFFQDDAPSTAQLGQR
jgi:hypothetical protein